MVKHYNNDGLNIAVKIQNIAPLQQSKHWKHTHIITEYTRNA